jgi:hypothetical protein
VNRHCDGTDPHLHGLSGEPCACGKRFDDVEHATVWPHHQLAQANRYMAGLDAFDLFDGHFCDECGRHKMDRLLLASYTPFRWPGQTRPPVTWPPSTGCATCDAVLTAHRCTGRPDLDNMCDADQWKCPGCGLVWHARVEVVISEERSWSTSRDEDDSERPATPGKG